MLPGQFTTAAHCRHRSPPPGRAPAACASRQRGRVSHRPRASGAALPAQVGIALSCPLLLAAPALLIALADHIFSASCGVKYHGQAHHRLTSTLPRSPGIITPPPAAAAQHPYPPAPPAHQSFPPRRAPAAPHPPPPPPPSPSPTIPVPTPAPPPHNHQHPHTPASLPPLSLNFRSSQAHHQVLLMNLILALPHRYNLPSPPSPAPRTVRGARAAPQRRAARRRAAPF